jgi:hypothetical protein
MIYQSQLKVTGASNSIEEAETLNDKNQENEIYIDIKSSEQKTLLDSST